MGETIDICNSTASTVIAMIESEDAVQQVDEIAAVDGVDVLLIGSADLSIDLGIPGQFNSERYQTAVQRAGEACRKHGKVLGAAGVYDNAELQDWLLNKVGVRFMLVSQDAPNIGAGAARAIQALPSLKK